jgi:hypothetical protein
VQIPCRLVGASLLASDKVAIHEVRTEKSQQENSGTDPSTRAQDKPSRTKRSAHEFRWKQTRMNKSHMRHSCMGK